MTSVTTSDSAARGPMLLKDPKKMALRPQSKSQYISSRPQPGYEYFTLCRLACQGCLTTNLPGLVPLQKCGVDRLAMLRLQEVVGKAENLKTVAIADDPEIQLVPLAVGGASLDEAHQTRLLFDGSIDTR